VLALLAEVMCLKSVFDFSPIGSIQRRNRSAMFKAVFGNKKGGGGKPRGKKSQRHAGKQNY